MSGARRGAASPPGPGPEPGLAGLGLAGGQRVRFRRPGRSRWYEGVVARREKDGSLRVRDADGAARAIPLERVEVPTEGPRGGARWEPVLERAARVEQLPLL